MSTIALGSGPWVRRDSTGGPVFGLTVALSRRPRPEETSVRHLVQHGLLGLELSVATPDTVFRAVTAALTDGETTLVQASGAGADPVLALSSTLSVEHTLAVLDALDGRPVGLSVAVRGEAGTAGLRRSVRLRGRWLDVHKRLANLSAEDGQLRHEQVLDALAGLLGEGAVQVAVDGVEQPDGVPAEAREAVAAAWLRAMSFLLRRDTTGLPAADPANRYTLRGAPSAGFPMDVTVTTTVPGKAPIAWDTPLSDVLGGIIDGLDPGRYVRYVALGEDPGGEQPADEVGAAELVAETEFGARAVRRPPGSPTPSPPPQLPLAWDPEGGGYPRDAARPGIRWYHPGFSLWPTQPESPRDGAGFLFTFAQKASGGLTGKVTFRLRQGTAEGAAAGSGIPVKNLRSLFAGTPTVALHVPFKDTATGQTRTQAFTARVSNNGPDWLAEVDLLDDWVRLAYGALSYQNFQSKPAELVVSYYYQATARGGEMLAAEAAEVGAPSIVEVPAVDGAGASISVLAAGEPPPVVADPRDQWEIFTQEYREVTTALFPCRDFPKRYLQQFTDGERVVGCKDALRLGEVDYHQFVEITELGPDFGKHCRVYRSLQQPGHFLVEPRKYRITRFPADDPSGRAYRPDVVVYAVLAEQPENTRYHIAATLQPELAPDLRRDLEHRLVPYCPAGFPPKLLLPTDASVKASDSYTWANTGFPERPIVQRTWDSIRVELSTGLSNAAMVLRMIEGTGYSGTVTFTLPDGTTLTSQLLLDSYVAGPIATGPVPASLSGTTATLVNRVERPVTVPELLTFTAAGVRGIVPNGQTLAAGQSQQLAVPAGVTGVWPRCVPAGAPLTIEELRVFVRDVQLELRLLEVLDRPTHGVKALRVDARVHAADPRGVTAEFTDTREVRLRLVLPVTDYLRANSVQVRFTRTMNDGSVVSGDWLPWDCSRKGNIITVDWALLTKPAG